MSADTVDVCVVGAGLSGAYAAHLLRTGGKRVAVLDARQRIGGRLLADDGGGDLGGAWVWPGSEHVMRQFLEEMGAETVPMHLAGTTMARAADGTRHVLPPGHAARYAACGGSAFRVAGGAAGMVEKLLSGDSSEDLSIHLGMEAVRIVHCKEDGATEVTKITCKPVSTGSRKPDAEEISIKCRAAILAAPPKVLASIYFDPPLPKMKMDSMLATPTWMGEYGKVSVSFPRNWWRDSNMSAISIDQVGAVSTWWEACSAYDDDGLCPTLAGFVTAHGAKALRNLGHGEALHDYIIDSLTKVYGVDASKMGSNDDIRGTAMKGSAGEDGLVVSKGGVTVTYKSWLEDPYTNIDASCPEVDITTDYGDKDLQQSFGTMFFAGTETAPGSGHMEGAIISAQRAVQEVNQYLK